MVDFAVRDVSFSMHPDLLSKQLGHDLYKPSQVLQQLIANALDADANVVTVTIHFNELNAPFRLTITDDGHGISPNQLDSGFSTVGFHYRQRGKREAIGSRGIGRFSVYKLGVESRWTTVAATEQGLLRQRWVMSTEYATSIHVETEIVEAEHSGTEIDITLAHDEDVVRLFSSVAMVRRTIFNGFAAYLARYTDEVSIVVNDQEVTLNEFIEDRETELIPGSTTIPEASIHHMVLSARVELSSDCVLAFASRGASIKEQPLSDEGLVGRKYLCLVDSPYLSELTNSNKTDLAEMDGGFQALLGEVTQRSRAFLERKRGDRSQSFLEKARSEPFYPFRDEPKTPLERYTRQVYDGVLLSIEETAGISQMSSQQRRLVFLLARQLLHSDDLASVLESVLGLGGKEVARFASLLRKTSLNSVIAVAALLVDRIAFLGELQQLVYGGLARHVRERSQLHKILETHTWLFGEQYHLMGSDKSIATLVERVANESGRETEIEDEDLEVDPTLRTIPDLYLVRSTWNEGAKFQQHLIVELKRPSVSVKPKHIEQLRGYARTLVNHDVFGQKTNSHQFAFFVVSSRISQEVVDSHYLRGQEPGYLGPPALHHPTELWALKWSDLINRRRQELKYLETEMEVSTDPETLEYLRGRVGQFTPTEKAGS